MTQMAQAKCPGCRAVVRIPAAWIGRSVRCKQCAKVFKAAAAPVRHEPPPQAIVIRELPSSAPPPPVRAAPAPADANNPFAEFALEAGPIVPLYRNRPGGPGCTLLAVMLGLFVLTALGGVTAFALFRYRDQLRQRFLGASTEAPHESRQPPPVALAQRDRDLPRRALAICVSDYWYANPVSYGEADLSVGALIHRLADVLRIPPGQVAELSDAASAPRLPLKGVIQGTIEQFLDTSRPQDRVLLLFAGHAATIDNQPYLVPIEGNLNDKQSLVPLSWLYERLTACAARQKVFVIDVCRHDPSRGLQRPESGPMSKALDALLRQPPPGVQVWSACSEGQYSYESSTFGTSGSGSRRGIFLSELWEAVGPFQKRLDLGRPDPQDALPVPLLAAGAGGRQGVDRATEAAVAEIYSAKQTPRLSGAERSGGAPFDPQAPPPPAPSIVRPSAPDAAAAPVGLVQSILEECGALADTDRTPFANVSLLPPFSLKVMAGYADDQAPAALRAAALRANRILLKHGQTLRYDFAGSDESARVKKEILEQQHEPARILAELNDCHDEMEGVAKELDRAAPRWRPTYQYVKGRLEARIAQLHEYDYMLGQIRMQALPKRDPLKHAGWRLAPDEKLHAASGSKPFAKQARETLKELAKKYPGTPWEILAHRLSVTALGLDWQLIPVN